MPIRRHRQHRDGLPDDLKYGHQKGKAAAIDTQPQQGADAADAVDEALRDLYIEIPDIDLKGIIEDDDEAAETPYEKRDQHLPQGKRRQERQQPGRLLRRAVLKHRKRRD